MSKTVTIIKELAKKFGIASDVVDNFEDRYVITDTFASIMASSKEDNLKLWPEAHKKFVDSWWEQRNADHPEAENTYEKVVRDKLSKCLIKPEVDIIDFGTENGVNYVVYTDTMDAMVLESEKFNGGNVA